MVLERINGPEDIRKIPKNELPRLAQEIRSFLIESTSVTGGHLASNLGVVELTMAMYLAFQPPKDKIIWDVGHQSYTHKILSGRKNAFAELRRFGGIAGFPKRGESPCDAFNTGHSSTSISAGVGMAAARDLRGEHYHIVSVIGDGALTGGMAYEALNNAGRLRKNFIIVLNDNRMSISENVGGMSQYLNSIRTSAGYNRLKEQVAGTLGNLPGIGPNIVEHLKNTKNGIKQMLLPGMLFENLGITYLGPVDGHDIRTLVRTFEEAKRLNHAVIVHVLTKKGKGYRPAELRPDQFHGVGPFDLATGRAKKQKEFPDYTDVFSRKLISMAERDPRIVAVTAAMPDGTGLAAFGKKLPERFFDVGIAEQHAVTSAAGLAAGGMKPVVAVYSSFLQRGFDQILHDVCIQNLPVVFAIDRAGLVGADGETHQGIFDLSFLGCIPNMTILAPKNLWELEDELEFACSYGGPIALRYPRGQAYRGLPEFRSPIRFGRGELLYEEEETAIVAVGSMVSTGEHVRSKLKAMGHPCTLANARFIKPIDTELLAHLAEHHSRIVTMEENVLNGGFGMRVADWYREHHPEISVTHIALPDAYVEHGDVSVLREHLGIDSDSILKKLKELYRL
ncbi:1-deoxy-D-xylulose-5-phosphate synthase [Fusobacterium naviforme]|uniref:1-deoxy-D-xylulose-5-phosphate synthase n=1 Tax=Moryella indoligenes TaxID=371674 RepID=A0AAE3VAU1_9FIRM|nr:1-deoxy-D-xylulose-5-phosphate synthase [Moryella indoligenes]KAB0576540.1 1-deoxy-D-xylulose-5-phosphate synthase [Fusobacterium naviforme]MDQ0152926.1 1-deoxy-D-xylulose-5-phosphate synthase [Moryella indoligenes]PSL09569.1 1-deoxy-D-xylulose-5-phosphate synthase [Fusobacterium naviforme]STO27439.1 1-deoxy-D-xylulose-5-phosphate synthase [Fusobacterium naviforme]